MEAEGVSRQISMGEKAHDFLVSLAAEIDARPAQ